MASASVNIVWTNNQAVVWVNGRPHPTKPVTKTPDPPVKPINPWMPRLVKAVKAGAR